MLFAPIHQNLITNVTAAAVSAPQLVHDFENVHITTAVTTAGASGATVSVFGSFETLAPDFTAAASLTNKYFPISVKNLDDVSNINGSTGIVKGASLTGEVRGYMVNTNVIRWLCVKVGSVTGTIDVSVSMDAAQVH